MTIARSRWVPRVTTRTRPYIPTRGFPLTTALRRAGYRVPDVILAREGKRLEADLRSALEKKETAS